MDGLPQATRAAALVTRAATWLRDEKAAGQGRAFRPARRSQALDDTTGRLSASDTTGQGDSHGRRLVCRLRRLRGRRERTRIMVHRKLAAPRPGTIICTWVVTAGCLSAAYWLSASRTWSGRSCSQAPFRCAKTNQTMPPPIARISTRNSRNAAQPPQLIRPLGPPPGMGVPGGGPTGVGGKDMIHPG
jgi:hypothetical protein